jgi:serine/threonine protein kinase/CHAT domain-containing protein/tetratricopeptide (TPR) repeat protein
MIEEREEARHRDPGSPEIAPEELRRNREPQSVEDRSDSPYSTCLEAMGPESGAGVEPLRDIAEVGKYKIAGLLGQGGMGRVYKAYDSELDRPVALKIPSNAALASGHCLDRFLREARISARLHHPSVVPVHDVGQMGDVPYLVSQFVRGETLDRRIREGPLAPRDAASLIVEVADALDHIHRAGVVHRDIKPSNIMLDEAGRIMITDFGLAKMEDGEASITFPGTVMGTLPYMSPEQISLGAHAVDRRSDIYSLGVVLYQLLTGRRPIEVTQRSDLVGWFNSITHEEPRPLRQLNRAVDRDLEIICLKCLQKDPERRYATAGELAEDLRRYLTSEPITARPLTPWQRAAKWARRQPAIAALIALSCVLVLVVLASSHVVLVARRQVLDLARERDRRMDAAWANLEARRRALDATSASLEARRRALDAAWASLEDRRRALDLARERGRALASHEEAQKVLGGGPADTINVYAAPATNLDPGARGKYAEAEPLFQQALTIRRWLPGESHPSVAQGDYTRALEGFQKALEIRRAALGEDHPDVADIYHNIAVVYRAQGDYTRALEADQKAMAIREKVLGVDHPSYATSLNNLAGLYRDMGEYARAEPLFRQALEITKKAVGEGHPSYATGLDNLAGLYRDMGEYARAEPLFRQALEITKKAVGEGHPLTARSSNNLAVNLQAQGNYAEAEVVLTETARSFEVARRRVSHKGLERAAFEAEHSSPLPLLAIVLARRGADMSAWQRLETSFARGLFDDLARPLEPDERRRELDLLARLQQLDEQVVALAASPGADEARRKQAEVVRQRRDALKIEWAEFEAGVERKYGVAVSQPYGLTRIQEHLPPDTALVTWLEYDRARPYSADPNGEHWACLVRQRGEPIWIKLPGSSRLGQWTEADDRLSVEVRNALVQPSSNLTSWRESIRRLAAQRLAPLQKHLGAIDDLPAVQHLIVLPSPSMAGIPVEALVEAQPKDASRYTVSYAPSGTMFAWLRERRALKGRGAPAPSPRLLALGDPDFAARLPTDASIAQARGPSLARLPGTRDEVRAIAGLFDQPEVLLGPNASEPRLDELARAGRLRDFNYLHLATHGQMDPDVAVRSRLFLARDQLPDPLARVLAGQEVYDGELTAEQILRTWKLDAELVTLSACQSSLGKPGGEGYLGFSQALFLAGARSVVLSLWKVDDEATALLMERFYANLLGRRPGLTGPMPKAEALREAKDWLRQSAEQTPGAVVAMTRGENRKLVLPESSPSSGLEISSPQPPAVPRRFAHPYYWAGFILIGDPS